MNDTARTFIFSGHLIVQRVAQLLRAQQPTEVLLTGCSAGGIGTFHSTDYLQSALPGVRVSGNPQAGWFGLPISDYRHVAGGLPDPDPYHFGESSWLMHASPYTGPAYDECLKHGAAMPNITLRCLMVPVLYPHLRAPLFVSENTIDAYQLFVQGGCPHTLSPAASSVAHGFVGSVA